MAGNTDAARALSREVGQRVRAIRLMRGFSQQKLATMIGVSFQQVQKYESGGNRISIPALLQICEALGAHPMDIIGAFSADDRAERPNVLFRRLEFAESKLARMQKIFAERSVDPT